MFLMYKVSKYERPEDAEGACVALVEIHAHVNCSGGVLREEAATHPQRSQQHSVLLVRSRL